MHTSPCAACLAGGIHERASGGASIFAREGIRARSAKPRVKFPPVTFRMVFAGSPLLSRLMIQLNDVLQYEYSSTYKANE